MIWHVSPPTSVALNCPLQDEQMVRFRVPMFFCQKWYIVNGAVPPALNKKLNWTRMFWNVLRLILFCQQKMGLVFFQCSVCCFGKLWRWQPAANKTHVEKKLLSADMVGGTSVNLTYGDTVVPSWSNRGTSGFEIKKGSWLDVILSWVIFFFVGGTFWEGGLKWWWPPMGYLWIMNLRKVDGNPTPSCPPVRNCQLFHPLRIKDVARFLKS